MADPRRSRPENVPGDLFVDATCIDCDTCRWMAPSVFARRGGQSAVVAQPGDPGERRAALHALVACPTASIGTRAAGPEAAQAAADFPLPVTEGVYHCGFHSRDSFGATSYLVTTPRGNVLVDAPRAAAPLLRRLEEMGGVDWLVLTHRDDVADHARFAERFGCRRVIHRRDVTPSTAGAEVILEGDTPVELFPGFTAIPTPGHTAGHVCYLWQGAGGALFTGDHLAWDGEAGRLEAWPDVCWHDWGEQTESMRRLAKHRFEWVLPGHGRRVRLPATKMRRQLGELVEWMESRGRNDRGAESALPRSRCLV